MSAPYDVRDVEYLGGYRLRLTFADGLVGEVDLAAKLGARVWTRVRTASRPEVLCQGARRFGPRDGRVAERCRPGTRGAPRAVRGRQVRRRADVGCRPSCLTRTRGCRDERSPRGWPAGAARPRRARRRVSSDQWEAIEALVEHRRRVLVVQRTGWGKSAVYFVATQAAARTRRRADAADLAAARLDAQPDRRGPARRRARRPHHERQRRRVGASDQGELERDEIDILLVSPERFANPQFRNDVLPGVAERVGLLVIDEAHCISDWGHDFRPDYRRLARVARSPAARRPGAVHDRDRERPRRRRRRRPTRRRTPRAAGRARSREPRARRRAPPEPAATAGVAGRDAAEAARHRHRLHADRRATRAGVAPGSARTASTARAYFGAESTDARIEIERRAAGRTR